MKLLNKRQILKFDKDVLVIPLAEVAIIVFDQRLEALIFKFMLHQHDGVNETLVVGSLVYVDVAVLDEESAAQADLLVFVGHTDFAVSDVQSNQLFLVVIF